MSSSSNVIAVQQFCANFSFTDLSPLISADLPMSERYAVCWSVIQGRINITKQRAFLRLFCKDSPFPTVRLLCSLVCMEIDVAQCNDAMGIILATEGAVDSLGASLKALCIEHNLNGTIVLMDKTGFEGIVYSIECVFRVTGERMTSALDHLKYDASPDRFAKAKEHFMKKREAAFNAKMTSLNVTLDRLKAEASALTQQLLEEEEGGQRSLAVTPSPSPPNNNNNGKMAAANTKRQRGGAGAAAGRQTPK